MLCGNPTFDQIEAILCLRDNILGLVQAWLAKRCSEQALLRL